MNEPQQLDLSTLLEEHKLLLGLMVGGSAYFLRQLMIGHQSGQGLTAQECEQAIVDALKRIHATQERFGYEYLSEIEAVLHKMSQTVPLAPYVQKVPANPEQVTEDRD